MVITQNDRISARHTALEIAESYLRTQDAVYIMESRPGNIKPDTVENIKGTKSILTSYKESLVEQIGIYKETQDSNIISKELNSLLDDIANENIRNNSINPDDPEKRPVGFVHRDGLDKGPTR